MWKTMPPCEFCEKRVLGCHSSCDEYKEYRVKHIEEVRQARRLNTERKEVLEYQRERGNALKEGKLRKRKRDTR